jgi:hypothetical protein
MVDGRIDDGERIAQLLASELTGLETGPLVDVTVVGADPDASPSPEGTRAYDVAYRSERIGTVRIYPERARLRLEEASLVDRKVAQRASVPATRGEDALFLSVEDGAAVKGATDALRALLGGD